MYRSESLYAFAKPPEPTLRQIVAQRSALDIDSRYGADRLHVTVLPLLLDIRKISEALIDEYRRAFEQLRASPFPVILDRIEGNMLLGETGGLRKLRDILAQLLEALALPFRKTNTRPHISLDYDRLREGRIDISPIRWDIDEILLVKSINGEGRHELVSRFKLGDGQYGLFD